jgi:hypothetical protein
VTFRAPASLGCADVLALKDGYKPRLIEVKGTVAGPYAGFLPAARVRLSLTAQQAGAEAWLAHWPAGGKLRWIPEAEWPT